MKLHYIQSQDLPHIDEHVKECINSGQWVLFKSNAVHGSAVFFLQADKEIYGLDATGNLLPTLDSEEVVMDELFYFSDVARPVSLSNKFSACA